MDRTEPKEKIKLGVGISTFPALHLGKTKFAVRAISSLWHLVSRFSTLWATRSRVWKHSAHETDFCISRQPTSRIHLVNFSPPVAPSYYLVSPRKTPSTLASTYASQKSTNSTAIRGLATFSHISNRSYTVRMPLWSPHCIFLLLNTLWGTMIWISKVENEVKSNISKSVNKMPMGYV